MECQNILKKSHRSKGLKGIVERQQKMSYNRIMDSQQANQVHAIRALTSEIPLNDFGMPTGIYRTDLLPFHEYRHPQDKEHPHNGSGGGDGTPVIDHEDVLSGANLTSEPHNGKSKEADIYRIAGFPATSIHGAFMPLQFDEGFPAFLDGIPFWGRLEYEPSDAYEAFQKYLQMSLGKASTEVDGYEMDPPDYDGASASGMRNISMLAADLFNDREILQMTHVFQEYFHLYYWGMRAHAYDLYRIAQYRTQQELRAVETQDEHYVQARRLRHRLMQYMNNEEEFWDMMTPKTGIDMFKTVTALERISAGVPAGGPISDANESTRGTPFEVTLRSVAQTNRRVSNISTTDEESVLDKALEDPKSVEILQELIIKSGGR